MLLLLMIIWNARRGCGDVSKKLFLHECLIRLELFSCRNDGLPDSCLRWARSVTDIIKNGTIVNYGSRVVTAKKVGVCTTLELHITIVQLL